MVLLTAALPGCLADRIAAGFTAPPNGGRAAADDPLPRPAFFDDAGTLTVPGPPPATLAAWVLHPAPARVTHVPPGTTPPPPPPGWRSVTAHPTPRFGHLRVARGPVRHTPPVATVLLLHGRGGDAHRSDTLRPLAAALADAGARVVAVDLRGHGQSTGGFVSYGHLEVPDLQRVLDELQRLDPDAGPFAVVGHSYGGGVAVQLAAADPRVRRVLALAPLVELDPARLPRVRFFLKHVRPVVHLFFGWALDDDLIASSKARMEARTGADLSRDNALRRVTELHDVPVLVLQGGRDPATPLSGSARLRDARPGLVELIVYPDADHTSFLREDWQNVEARTRRWLKALAAGP